MSAFDRRSAVTQSVWTTAKSDCNYGAHSSKINESVSTTIERQNKIRCHAEGKSDRFYHFFDIVKIKKNLLKDNKFPSSKFFSTSFKIR